MSSRLQEIMDAHRRQADADRRSLEELTAEALATSGPRGFAEALRRPGISVIAEIKRRSPSAGDIAPNVDPVAMAAVYEAGGAACLSVLTDEDFFGGSVDDLRDARNAVRIPVLRKDFTIDARDIADARIMGADAVLLIAAGLSDDELRSFIELASQLHLAALVETHSAEEIDRALSAGATIVGVNQRNLHTFEIDRRLAVSLRGNIPDGVIAVAESGIRDANDVGQLIGAGYDAILVGTSLVSADDPAASLRRFVAVGTRA